MIETKHKYDYYRQENGNYTVFRVPIFGVTDQGDGREVSIQNLQNIVQKMQSEKARGWYARLIVGHQSDEDVSSNAPGAGFIDNFELNEEEGILYADYVEVPPEKFQELERYPGRSCEYRPDEELLESLALLESRTPYFRFPIFRLGRELSEVSKFTREAALLRFQAISNGNSLVGGINPDLKNTHKPKEDFVSTRAKSRLRRENRDLKRKYEALRKKYEAEEEEKAEESEEPKAEAKPEGESQPEPAPTESKEPDAVAPQETDGEDSGEGEEDPMEYMRKCMAYMGECMQKIESYMSNMDKPKDLDSLAMQDPKRPNKYTKSIGAGAKAIADGYKFRKENNSIVAKYQHEKENVRDVARRAAKDWEDTANQNNRIAAQKFTRDFPCKEKFVDSAVDQEKASPGSYDAIYHG